MLKRNHKNCHNKTRMLFVCLNIALLSVSVWLFVLVCVLATNANARPHGKLLTIR